MAELQQFPTGVDTYNNPQATDPLLTAGSVGLTTLMTDLQNASIQVQTKLGTGASVAAANQILTATGTGTSSWAQITNAMVSSSAAIAYSKLNLTGTIVNADVGASAAIAYSKLNLAASILTTDLAGTAWTTYTPVWGATSGTPPAVGNGQLSGKYIKFGKTVTVNITMIMGLHIKPWKE